MSIPPCSSCGTWPSIYYCTCVNPPVAFCEPCAQIHSQIQNQHVWGNFPVIERTDGNCEMCKKHGTEIICCCKFPVICICSTDCHNQHTLNFPSETHILQPASKATLIKSIADIEKARKTLAKTDEVKAFLNANLKRIADFSSAVHNEVEKAIIEIRAMEEKIEEQIREFKVNLEKELISVTEETEKRLFESQTSGLQGTLLRYIFSVQEQFNFEDLFSGEVHSDLSLLSNVIITATHFPNLSALPQSSGQVDSHTPMREEESKNSVSSLSKSTPKAPDPRPLTRFNITEEEKAAFHQPCLEQKSGENPEVLTTVGRHRLPISMLQGSFKWNKLMVSKFEGLLSLYGAWRRSRGDGNCFYRCLGVLYLEHLFRATTPIEEVKQLYELIYGQQGQFMLSNDSGDVIQGVKMLCDLVKDLYRLKCAGGNALQTLQYHLMRSSIDRSVILSMRKYTAAFFWLHQTDQDVAPFIESAEQLYWQILHYGEEAEGLALKLAARTLNVVIYIQTVDNKSENVTVTKYGPAQAGCYPALHMLHLPGHFNCLIPQETQEADQYDFGANTYSGVAGQRIIGYEQFTPED